jgi:hypothetical protein
MEGFTPLSEQLGPEEAYSIAKENLSKAIEIYKECGAEG